MAAPALDSMSKWSVCTTNLSRSFKKGGGENFWLVPFSLYPVMAICASFETLGKKKGGWMGGGEGRAIERGGVVVSDAFSCS